VPAYAAGEALQEAIGYRDDNHPLEADVGPLDAPSVPEIAVGTPDEPFTRHGGNADRLEPRPDDILSQLPPGPLEVHALARNGFVVSH